MAEEGLRNLLTLKSDHQNRPKQFRTTELHCWSFKEESTEGSGPGASRDVLCCPLLANFSPWLWSLLEGTGSNKGVREEATSSKVPAV